MKQYLKLIKTIIKNGNLKKDRTGTGTLSIFGYNMRFDLKKGFPLVTTKNVIYRLLFMNFYGFLKEKLILNI